MSLVQEAFKLEQDNFLKMRGGSGELTKPSSMKMKRKPLMKKSFI